MISGAPFFDTNILLYSISAEAAEAAKRERATALLLHGDGALSVQVLQEFYVQATRPTRTHPVPHHEAVNMVTAWTRFRVQEMNLAVLEAALDIKAAYGFSYWDCAIIAAAQALGCREIYTEDMNDGQRIGGVTIVNPFR